MGKRASVEKLDTLHDMVASYYADLLQEAKESGEVLPSGFMSSLVTFLKNNGITAEMMESEPMMDLQARFRELIEQERAG